MSRLQENSWLHKHVLCFVTFSLVLMLGDELPCLASILGIGLPLVGGVTVRAAVMQTPIDLAV